MARLARFERAAFRLGGGPSILLRYRRKLRFNPRQGRLSYVKGIIAYYLARRKGRIFSTARSTASG